MGRTPRVRTDRHGRRRFGTLGGGAERGQATPPASTAAEGDPDAAGAEGRGVRGFSDEDFRRDRPPHWG